AGAAWREDDSNASDRFFRNRVRRHVLPRLLEASPSDALAGFAASRSQLEEDDLALDAWLTEIAGRREILDTATFARLKGRPRALVRRAVQRWLVANDLAASLEKSSVERMIQAVEAGSDLALNAGRNRRVSIKKGRPAIVRVEPWRGQAGKDPRSKLRGIGGSTSVWTAPFADDTEVVPPANPSRSKLRGIRSEGGEWPRVILEPGGEMVSVSGGRLSLRKLRAAPRLLARLAAGKVDPATTAIVAPPDDWDGRFFARSRRPGDRFRPLGAPGRMRVQDLLVNRKVPRELRDGLPVVIDSTGAIVWVPGAPPAREFAVQPCSKTVVQLTYARPAGNVPQF
ncbi:MAG: tRNA lysidine(34) synthetase TilS, partial [Opitutaceae bacterium]